MRISATQGCMWSNDTEEAALHCLRNLGGSFYDGCREHCYTDQNLMRLTHNLQLESVVYGQIFPILIFFVVVANVLVAVVLSQKHMVTPTNVVLKYMAIADLCVGLVPLPWTFFYYTLKYNEHEDDIELWWCYMYKYSMDAVPPVCHNVAMWLTVLLAGQRYISIEYPIKSRRLCSVKNVRLATVVITIVSLLCGLPKSFDYYYDMFDGWAYVPPGQWISIRSCVAGFTALVGVLGQNTFFNFYFWTRVLAFIILPSLLLIILNVLLIRGIRRAQKRKERLLKEKRAREAQRQNDSNSTSLMLVVIVSIFLIVNLPQAIFMGMLCVCNTFGISNRLLEGIFPVAFLLANNMLVMATYPINFGIYCFMSSSFRLTFRALFCPKSAHDSLNSVINPTATSSRPSVRKTDSNRSPKGSEAQSFTPILLNKSVPTYGNNNNNNNQFDYTPVLTSPPKSSSGEKFDTVYL
ncbi:hypothetical protein L596_003824 [Steinernema carpocapsae]|uniref:G-protein coupled receptors family 1 profile domain-containing protein n=1 Tax=Steinernema carpocapsae TaxID=34508 RepID=A0A4U8UVG4_STECR|nr:hypothetical protein L596_003824 [Steinernema carpocapsae]